MKGLPETSKVIADDLRRTERSINLAMRDTAQLLMNTLDAVEIHGVSPSMALRTIKATIGALASLAESQQQISVRAHVNAEKVGTQLGLTETCWGEGTPKPPMADREALDRVSPNTPAFNPVLA